MVFGSTILILWLCLIPLALEFGTVAVYVYRMNTNPLVQARATGHIPQPETGSALQTPHPTAPPKSYRPLDLSGAEREVLYRSDALRADEESWIAWFGSLGPSQRGFAARLHGIVAVSVDAEGEVLAIYGPPSFERLSSVLGDVDRRPIVLKLERFAEWRAAVKEALPGVLAKGVPMRLDTDASFLPFPCAVTLVPSGGGQEAAIVLLRVDGALSPPQPDSRYEIPAFNLKRGFHDGADYATNELGWRDDPIALPKPAGTFRILCLGSSTTEEGITNSQTYPNLLEFLLNRDFPGHRIEVINCGVPGTSSAAHVLRYSEYLDLQPDLVLIYEGINDVLRNSLLEWRYLEAPAIKRILSFSRFCLAWGWRWLLPTDGEIDASKQSILDNLSFLHKAFGAHGIPVAVSTIAVPNTARLSEEEQFYLDFNFPNQWWIAGFKFLQYEYLLQRYNEALASRAREQGMILIPVAEKFDGTLDKFQDFCHMFQCGIEEKAAIMHAELRETVARLLGNMPPAGESGGVARES